MASSQHKILVTGCAGFIGSHLISHLLSNGHQVDGVDNFSTGGPENILQVSAGINIRHVPAWFLTRWEAFEEGSDSSEFVLFHDDFSSDAMLARVLSGKYSAVIHLAAEPSVEKSVAEPVLTYMNNVQKTVSLMHACATSKTKFVFASSAAVYGNCADMPVSEEAKCAPMSPYALQKKQVEEAAALFSTLYNLEYKALRFFNVYGPGQDGGSAYSTVIASWRERLANGDDLRLDGDGEQTRDYVHVSDVAEVCMLAVDTSTSGIFNIATGVGTSNNTIIAMLKKRYNFNVDNSPARIGDIKHSVASTGKASRELGFSCSINIEEGIDRMFPVE